MNITPEVEIDEFIKRAILNKMPEKCKFFQSKSSRKQPENGISHTDLLEIAWNG